MPFPNWKNKIKRERSESNKATTTMTTAVVYCNENIHDVYFVCCVCLVQCVYEFWIWTFKRIHSTNTYNIQEKWIWQKPARKMLKIVFQLYAKHCADRRVKLNEFRNPFRRNLLVLLLNKINYPLYGVVDVCELESDLVCTLMRTIAMENY